MQNINKKAISSVIGTVLIVFLGVSLVGVLGGIIIEIAKQPQYSPESSCLDFNINAPIEIKDSCYDPEKGEVRIKLSRTFANVKIGDLKVAGSGQSGNQAWSCIDGCGTCTVLEEGSTKEYILQTEITDLKTITVSSRQCFLDSSEIKAC